MGRARSVLAYGGLDGVVQRPLFHETGTFPQFAASADGCRITDTTGQTFLDWANGWGPVLLGYRYPAVEAAIVEQLSAGPTLTLMHPIEVEVAELLRDMVPSAEMVVFGKNGSDVVGAALRVARAATGRDVVLQHGFHGFHEWHQVQNPEVKGIPTVLRSLVDAFDYDDLDGLERLLRRRGRNRRVAAIIMEPTNTHVPPPGYLEGVRALADHHGAILIFDEIVTAFRFARGGAQELYGVLPDLTCLGKAMGNGMPISALVGRRELMQLAPSVGYGLTFRGETLSLAAAKAVLTTIEQQAVVEHLAAAGSTIRDRFEPLAAEVGLPCRLLGHPSRMTIGFESRGDTPWEHIRWLFLQECLRHGLITNGTLLASYAHDEEALDETMACMESALRAVEARVSGRSTAAPLHPTGGSPFGPRAFDATGFIEHLALDGADLRMQGWLQLGGKPPASVAIEAPDTSVEQLALVHRPDIRSFGSGPSTYGFVADVRAATFTTEVGHELTIVATGVDGSVFRCPVVLSSVAGRTSWDGPFPLADGVLHL